jgi:hypothetical protein
MSESFSVLRRIINASEPGPSPLSIPDVIGSLGRWVGANNGVTASGAGIAGACDGRTSGVDANGAPDLMAAVSTPSP